MEHIRSRELRRSSTAGSSMTRAPRLRTMSRCLSGYTRHMLETLRDRQTCSSRAGRASPIRWIASRVRAHVDEPQRQELTVIVSIGLDLKP